jgi:hypothetical protein
LTAAYYDMLGRGGSPEEQATYLQSLASGAASTTTISSYLLASPEYQYALIQSYYENYLGRKGVMSELMGWVTPLQEGYTDQDVLAGILNSDEAFGKRS